MQALGGTGVLVATGTGATADVLSTLEQEDGTVGALGFFSPASQLAADEENDPHSELKLERGEDDDIVLVWAEPEAGNFETTPEDEFDEQETIIYDDPEDPEGVEIPLISQDPDQPVVGIGTTEFVENGRGGFRFDNEEFLLNLFDEKITSEAETATVGYDEGHGQFLSADEFSIFANYVADHGYEIEGSDTLFDDVVALEFPSTASQVDPDGEALTDESVIAVWAEQTAENVDDAGDEASHIYDEDIPLVSRDGTVVGFGTPELVADDDGITDDNVQFLLNVLGDTIGDSGTLLWDDAHDTFYDSSGFTQFADAIESNGYEFAVAEEDIGGGDDGEGSVADPATPGSQSVHSWLLTDVEYGNAGNDGDEVDTITVSYPESASFDGLNQDDITVVMTRTLADGEDTAEISVNQGDYSGSEATFDLSGFSQTDVAGPIELEIDGIQNPDEAGEFDVDITLDGDAGEVTVTETLVIEENGDDSTLEPVGELEFFSTASLVAANGDALTDDSLVPVWAEETAYTNEGTYRNSDDPAGEGSDIPLVAIDDRVVGIGSDFATDASDFDENRAFLANAFEETLPEGATILYDESHGQSLALSDYGDLESEAESRGFSFDAVPDGFESAINGEDALMIVGADDGDGGPDIDEFTQDELDALETFVDEGGALFLFSTADFEGDSSEELNDVLSAVNAAFRFNSDQVEDEENSGFAPFVVQTSNFNEVSYPDFFGDDEDGTGEISIDADAVAIPSPSTAYTQAELDALETHVADGGAVLLFDESEFVNEETANLNEIAGTLDVGFRFNADQVEDAVNNGGPAFVPRTTRFNDNQFPALFEFEETDGLTIDETDALMITSPSVAYTQEELSELSAYVADGGAVFIFDESDFGGVDSDIGGFDETENLNEIASSLALPFRFNSDQVNDLTNNAGPVNEILSANYDDAREDLGNVFDSRGDGLGIDFDRDETYFAKVVRVFDGDTFEVEFLGENGYRETIRHLGMDTAETGDATNETEEWFGIGDDELDHLDTWGSNATEFSLDLMARGGDDPDAGAGETNIDGRVVRVEFDDREPLRGNFGRLLAYMYYDEEEYQPEEFEGARDADPDEFDETDFDRDYNLQTVEEGYARVYSSGFGRHDEYAAEEEQALADGEGVWAASDFDSLTEIRNHSVNDVFIPNPSSITSADGQLTENVLVRASSSADQEPLADEADEYDEPPLAAFDPDNRVAMFGGILLHEIYEEGEGSDVTDDLDLSTVGNFPLFTNVVEMLSENDGSFIIEGGHGQFNIPGSVPLERVQFYLRYVEGLSGQVEEDVRLRQINSLDETLPEEDVPPRVVFLTAPDREYTDAELDALRAFRDDGGAVILIGSQDAPAEPRAELNRIAEELDSDLRLNDDAIVDEENAVAGNSRLLLTDNFDDDAPGELFLPTDLTREIEPPEVTVTLNNVGSEAWILTDADAGVGQLGEDGLEAAYNPTLTLEVGTRHRLENDGWDDHPIAFEDADGETLLSQDGEGSFGDNTDVAWVDDGDGVEFTVTEALAAELAGYRCTVHGGMTGSVETTAELGPPQLDIGFDGPPQSTQGDGLFDDVTGSGDSGIGDVQALFDYLASETVQANAGAFNFAGIDAERVTVFDVQALFTRIDS